MCQQIDKEGEKHSYSVPRQTQKSPRKLANHRAQANKKSLKKIATMNYLFSLVSELALPFDCGRSGSFSSDFLVGFRGFDSFQFRHLAVAGQNWSHALFSISRERTKIQPVGFTQENLLSDGHSSGNKGRKYRPKLFSQKSWTRVKFVAYISCHYF